MLEVSKLTKKFKKKNAVDDLSISFGNKIYGLLGPNGAGKTTLMRCLVNLYPSKPGRITWGGADIAGNSAYFAALGYLPQKFGVYRELTVTEMLMYFGSAMKMDKEMLPARISEVLELVNLLGRAKDKTKSLSGGMIRRLGVAQALLGDPKVLIMDEPTSGLDPEERRRFKDMIVSLHKDKTVLISTHIIEDIAEMCDEVIVMNLGKILMTGALSELSGDDSSIEDGYLCLLQDCAAI